ncbi:MAG: spore maturation protein, partial [Bacteroidetes bacterium]|nr:spore maturation protein [Bacteroidota bacterium]
MALSRIWAAFILISIVVAGVRYAFVKEDKEILSSMVTGKVGDTLYKAPVAGATAVAPGMGSVAAATVVKVQKADGLIETCKNAVTLAIGLIGIMALFMGLISIAEAAGGVRLLARITGPFFSKLFPDIPKGHP